MFHSSGDHLRVHHLVLSRIRSRLTRELDSLSTSSYLQVRRSADPLIHALVLLVPSVSLGGQMAHPLWQIQLDLVFNVGAVNELRSTGDVLLMGPVARHCRLTGAYLWSVTGVPI